MLSKCAEASCNGRLGGIIVKMAPLVIIEVSGVYGKAAQAARLHVTLKVREASFCCAGGPASKTRARFFARGKQARIKKSVEARQHRRREIKRCISRNIGAACPCRWPKVGFIGSETAEASAKTLALDDPRNEESI